MTKKPSYEELQQRVKELEKEAVEHKRAKEELQTILNVVPVIIFQKNKDGKTILTNQAFDNMIGLSKEEIIGKTTDELFPEHGKDMMKDDQEVMELGKPKLDIIERYDSPEGTRWARTGKAPIKDKEGNVVGLIGYAADITEQKQAEEKIKHLTLVLRAIRNVNQLIVREKERDKLLKGACKSLTETRGLHNTWIALLDENGDLITTAEAGLGKDFLPMIERLKSGEFTACGQKAISHSGVLVTKDPSSTCTDCPLSDKYHGRASMAVRLEHRGKIYGLLSVSVPANLANDEEEMVLVDEIARDIAFALHAIELEERHKRAEEELREHHDHLEQLVAERTAELTKVNELLEQDISERKRVQEALRESEERYKGMFNYTKNGVAIYKAINEGKDFIFVDLNRSGEKIDNIRRDELIGKRVTEKFAGVRDFGLFEVFQRVWATGKPEHHSTAVYKDERITGWRNNFVYKLPSEEIVAVYSDETERKRAEEALRASQEYTKNVIDSSMDIIITANKDRNIVELNKAAEETFGYSREEVIGKLTDILYADPQEGIAIHKKIVEQGHCVQEVINRRKSGEVFPSFLSASLLRDAHGEVVGVMGVSRDITKSKLAEEQIKASLKEKDVLLKEIHHRVKNNLQVISSLLDMRIMRTDNQQTIDLFEDIRSKIHTMALIHAQLYQSERFDRINMETHVQELVNYLSSIYTKRGISIIPIIEASDVYLSATQAIPCALVLNELLSNAFKHAFKEGQKGTIEISLKKTDHNKVLLQVKDNGIGIPDEIDIFKTDSLGFKLMRNTVQDQLMGKIHIEKGVGTTIVVEFKILEEEVNHG